MDSYHTIELYIITMVKQLYMTKKWQLRVKHLSGNYDLTFQSTVKMTRIRLSFPFTLFASHESC